MSDKKEKKTVDLRSMKPGSFRYIAYKVKRNPLALTGVIVIIILFILSFISPYICKYGYADINMKAKFMTPCADHPFGCDELGRDTLSRILYGAKYTMSIGIFSTAISQSLGIIIGSIAGYFGGKVDNLIMRILDVVQAFPGILLAITISAILGAGYSKVIIAMGISGIAGAARMMRANILSVRNSEYIEAAKSMDCSTFRIITKHIIPNAISPMIVSIAMGIGSSGLAASALSFLGFGVQPPTPEWGGMLSSARAYIRDYPHLAIFPGIFIMITVLAYNLLGDCIRDAMDPKLKD